MIEQAGQEVQNSDAPHISPHSHGRIPNGIWTIAGPRGHRTVSIDTQPDSADFAAGKRIVSLLVSSSDDYRSFGFVSDDSRRITVWRSKRGVGSGPSDYERLASALTSMFVRGVTTFGGQPYSLLGEATCLRCNRRLTTPDSIQTGMGPDCASRSR